MFYKWELLDLDNRVTVTMGNLSEIGGGNFAQLRMYDRSIHLWCLTYDRPPKHKNTASTHNSWIPHNDTVVVTLAQQRGWHASKLKHGKWFQRVGVRSGLRSNQGGIFRPLSRYLQEAPGAQKPPAGAPREKMIWRLDRDFFYRDAVMILVLFLRDKMCE